MSDDSTKQLTRRLDVLLSVALSPIGEKATEQEKIRRLDSFGFTPAEIASILGSTSDKISKQLYVIRKNRKKNRK